MKKTMVILSVLLVAFLIFGALSKSKPKLSRKTASSYHDQQLAEGFTHVKLLVPPDKNFAVWSSPSKITPENLPTGLQVICPEDRNLK